MDTNNITTIGIVMRKNSLGMICKIQYNSAFFSQSIQSENNNFIEYNDEMRDWRSKQKHAALNF